MVLGVPNSVPRISLSQMVLEGSGCVHANPADQGLDRNGIADTNLH